MHDRCVIRRFVIRAGVTACVVLLCAILGTKWWSVSWDCRHYWGAVQWGGIYVGYKGWIDESRWYLQRNSAVAPNWWWFDYQPGTPSRASCFIIPLWLPLAAIGATTYYAWRRGRRHPPGHCAQCGYNLTGNTSGTCPECGRAVTAMSEGADR